MNESVKDLTDKEKEALRLLLAGHDTKSSAAQLDISVHTVNDRLRNARRKLSVSSSREAARILGDAEGDAPQNPAHTSFGIGKDGSAADIELLDQPNREGPIRFNWLAGGMLIMSLFIAAAILAVVSFNDTDDANTAASSQQASSTQATEAAKTEEAASLKEAQAFIAAVDAGDWTESWNLAGAFFHTQMTADEWAAVVEPVRSPLGEATDRKLLTVQKTSTLPGAPEGDFEVLQFETTFAQAGMPAFETVVMMKNGDTFDVAGYFIRGVPEA